MFLLFHSKFDFSSFAFLKNPKFQKEIKRTLEKRKGKVAFHFFAFGRWDAHLGDMCEWGPKLEVIRASWPIGRPLLFHFSTFSSLHISF
jgi:hypothetical protein